MGQHRERRVPHGSRFLLTHLVPWRLRAGTVRKTDVLRNRPFTAPEFAGAYPVPPGWRCFKRQPRGEISRESSCKF